MVTRVNGGVFDDQVLTGSLCHYTVTGADFSGAVSDGSIQIPDGAGPNIPFIVPPGAPVPGSAAEIILLELEKKATIVIMNPDEGGTGLYFAIENTDNGWAPYGCEIGAAAIQLLIRSLGTDVGVDDVDCSGVIVENVPYVLGAGAMAVTTFLELIDTPSTYDLAAGYIVQVNASATGLEFVPGGGGGGGETNTGNNLGAGEGVFAQKNGVVLEFKSLIGGNNVTLSSTGTEITIDMDQLSSDDILNDSTVPGATTVTDALNLLDGRVATNTTDILNLQNSVATLEISDLIDVDTTGVTDGQILIWNNTAGEWQPGTAATGNVDSVFGRTGVVVAAAGDYTAAQVTYDNASSGLTATEVQAAIDELDTAVDAIDLVAGTALQPGDNVSELTNDAGYISDITAESIGDLSDVDITGINNGEILVWNSGAGEFEPGTQSGGTTTFVGLTDTPANYTSSAGLFARVNVGETALEFSAVVVDADNVTVDASGFTGNLDSGDTDVQTALATLDQINTEFNYIVVSTTSTLASANAKYMVVTDGVTITLPTYAGLNTADNIRIAKTADIDFDIETSTGEDILLENGNTVSSVNNNKARELLFLYDGTQWSMLI